MYSNTWFEISHLWKVEKRVGRKSLVFYIIQIKKFYLYKSQNRDSVFQTFNLCLLEQKSYFVSVLVCILFQGQNYFQEWKVKPASEKFLRYLLFCDLYDVRRLYIYIYIEREREGGIDIDCCSVFQSRTTFSDHMVCSKPGFLVLHHLQRLLKFMSIESVMPSNYFILCRPLLLLPSIFPSIRVFSNGLVLHIRWPEYWNFSSIITPFSEYSGLIFFRIDWFSLYRWKA